MLATLLIRFIAAYRGHLSHPTDMFTFSFWSHQLANRPLNQFYAADFFSDYTPGYMYILALLGHIRNFFDIELYGDDHAILMKIPTILFDLLTVIFIYRIAQKFYVSKTPQIQEYSEQTPAHTRGSRFARSFRRHFGLKHDSLRFISKASAFASRFISSNRRELFALTAGLFYALNPLIILTGAIWGQVEAIHTFLLLTSVYLLTDKKILVSAILFALSILVKPHSLMFAPIYLIVFFRYVCDGRRGVGGRLARLLIYGGICAIVMLAMFIPFIDLRNLPSNPLEIPAFAPLFGAMDTYPFLSVNAYNFYSFFGLNWFRDFHAPSPLGISFLQLGIVFLMFITLYSFYLLMRAPENKSNYFFVGAMLVFFTFMLFVRMHERYNFPALAFLLMAWVLSRDNRIIRLYWGLTAAFLLNYVDVLNHALNGFDFGLLTYSARIFAIPSVVLFVYMFWLSMRLYAPPPIRLGAALYRRFGVVCTKYKDAIAVLLITGIFAVAAFHNLGDLDAPQTAFRGQHGDEVIVDFGSSFNVTRIQHMLGSMDNREFRVEFSSDGSYWQNPAEINAVSVFAWNFHDIPPTPARFARITVRSSNFNFLEMGFRDAALNLIPIAAVSYGGEALFDEQHLVPREPRDFMHSTYFDEVFHPRTAYEFIHGLNVFEWTHPPLGKVIISWGISLFGMTPFGWRFMGTLFGVMMLPLMYAMAKSMFKSTFWASFATLLFAVDFMRFAQTRLATIDTYVVFFIMGMYYFMYRYTQMNFYRDKLSKTFIPLALSGIFAGLAIASKWQGAYAIIGIAVIFLITLFMRFKEYQKALNRHKFSNFWHLAGKTCLACIGFFILIPAVIYALSYIPFYNAQSRYPQYEFGFFGELIRNQYDMFIYHSRTVLGATHPFSSNWYHWIFNTRPIFYFANTTSAGLSQGISAFGNPALIWAGLIAVFYTTYRFIKTRDMLALFLIIGYLSQLLPWIPIGRLTFAYHYFPAIVFLVLMLTYAFKEAKIFTIGVFTSRYQAAVIFIAINAFLFIMFYPVLSGMPISRGYVDFWLRWLPHWRLI